MGVKLGDFWDFPNGDEIIEQVKKELGINKPNSEMTDDEIKMVIRKIGEMSPDTGYDMLGEPIFNEGSINLMLTFSLHFFPRYYDNSGLSQFN